MAAQEASQPLRWRYGGAVDDGNFAVRARRAAARGAPRHPRVLRVRLHLPPLGVPPLQPRSDTSLLLLLVVVCHGARCCLIGGRPRRCRGSRLASDAVSLYRRPPEGEDVDTAQCSICLGEFEEGEQVKALPRCGHRFHQECVDAWLRSRPSCPLCRGSLLADTTNKTDAGSEAV